MKSTPVDSFLKELENDLQKYPGHIYRAKWQHQQVQTCMDNLDEDTVLMMMDFSENYRCQFQYESQSAYFDQRQVTVHPLFFYYKENLQGDGNISKNFLVKHSIIVISNDLKHDAFAVRSFEEKALGILNINRKIQDFKNILLL